MKSFLRNIFSIAFPLVISSLISSGCANTTVSPPPSYATPPAPKFDRVYRLDMGDRLKLTSSQITSLAGTYDIDREGTVLLPIVGRIPAKDKTLEALSQQVRTLLSDRGYAAAELDITVINYRPFSIKGEVVTAGNYGYSDALSFKDAVKAAGGYTFRADKTYVLVSRENQPERRVELPSKISVFPGDKIRIPARFN